MFGFENLEPVMFGPLGGRVGPTCGKCPVGSFTSYIGSCTKCGDGGYGLGLLGSYKCQLVRNFQEKKR